MSNGAFRHKKEGAAHGWFDGTFGNLEGSKSLRDLVAHNHALTEGIRTCFGITRVPQSSALVIDCEISLRNQSTSLAILATTHESVKYLSYLVLNSAATMMKVPQLHLEAYYPLWHNRTVALQTIRTMTLDGFEIGTDNVKPSIFENAVEF